MGGTNSFSHYGTSIYPRPNDDIDPKNKDQKWHADWCKYIYAYGCRQDNSTPYSNSAKIQLNRAYAKGEQDTGQYLRRFEDEVGNKRPTSQTDFDSNDNSQQGRSRLKEGYMNINPEILPVFPKYLSLLLGKYSGMDHDITAEARDLKSGVERLNTKWNTWFESENREFLDNYYSAITNKKPPKPDFIPESIEELELFEALGGFKLKQEIAMEILIGHSFDISEWSGTIKKKILEDFIENNIAATQDYLDITTNKVKTRYLDIANLIVPYNTENEYQNPEFHGYIRLYRAAELRLHDIPEERIKTYAKNAADDYGNLSWESVEAYDSSNTSSNVFAYDDFLIPVMEAEWESVDTYFDQTRINKEGRSTIKEEFYDVGKHKYSSEKYKNRPDRNIKRHNIKNRYQAKWILNSDDILSYGKIYDTVRADNDVRSSVHVYKLNGKSILERCKPNLDEIQIEWLKFQNNVAIAAPPGIAVEYDALSNISTGDGTDFHPLDILKIRSQTGSFIYKVTAMGFGGEMSRSGAGKPFEELRGGMGDALNEFNSSFALQISMIQQNSGVSAPADASNPNPNQSVKGSEMALAATSNTLRPLYDGYLYIKTKVADNTTFKIQLLIKDNPEVYKAYYPVLGKVKLQTLKVAGKISASQFGIAVEARATDQMKLDIKEQIKIGMAVGREGQSSLKSSQGLMLLNMVENGTSLKLITAMLQHYESKEAERLAEKASENIEAQGEQARMNDEAKAKAEQAKLQLENDLEIKKAAAIEAEKRKTEMMKHENKMAEIQITAQLNSINSPINNN